MKNEKITGIIKKVKSFFKKFFIELIILLLIFIGVSVYLVVNMNNSENNDIELSKTLKADKKYRELDINDIDTRMDKNGKHFTFYVENNTDKVFEERKVKIVFLNKKKETVFEDELLLHEIKAHEKVSFDYILEDECFEAHTFIMIDSE